jgi:arylmalonate decarboxylase
MGSAIQEVKGMLSRRQFVGTSVAAVAGAQIALGADPLLGLIFPVDRPIPEEGLAMYPKGVRFVTAHLDLKTMTPDGYDAVLADIPIAARKLKAAGVQAITLMGTSLTFYKGEAFNQSLAKTIREATNLPVTTMSTAVIEGLRAMKTKRLAVATAYNDEVNARLRAYLGEMGFEVLALKGLGIEAVAGVNDVKQDDLLKFCVSVFKMAPSADGMLVSCGGLRTLEILAPLEAQTKVPAISSTPHALRAGVRLLKLSGRAPGYGRLLAQG